ncbi:hypothetical protein ES332_A04G011400v1 [Gossypium tomentosum]|uniref:Ataxin 2 SM domain-containing protein n=1 Tax=Gossypium tomentosum TaxID=34277 RepID=A0A5D2QTR9_GOSTO|nr:hypothetical protein ES332_A04G011400v1 [Gossypium tomentosum]
MELKNRVEEENCLMNEALLLATMYILGLPVDMHLTDGSVYSGIFHTAAVEKEFGNNRECPEKDVEGEEDAEKDEKKKKKCKENAQSSSFFLTL